MINYLVTFALVIGLLMFAFGVFSFVFEGAQNLHLPAYGTLALLGVMLLFFGVLFGKMFSRVRWQ